MHIITGGAGFIGSNIAARLDDEGQDIIIVDSLGNEDKWRNISKRRVRDIISPDELHTFLSGAHGVSSILHMGAISTTTESDVDLIVKSNFRLSVDLWRWCALHRVPFIYASSAATYGDGEYGYDDQFSEEYLSHLFPLNAYGWSKHIFDRWVLGSQSRGEVSPPRWAGLKFFNVYGPNEYHKGGQRSVAVQMFEQIQNAGRVRLFKSDSPNYADGGQTRDFVWVEDCVDVALWPLRAGNFPSSVYNVGSGLPRTFSEKAQIVFDVLGKPELIEYIELPEKLRGKYQYYTCAALNKLRDAGYGKEMSTLEAGLRAYIETYLKSSDPYR